MCLFFMFLQMYIWHVSFKKRNHNEITINGKEDEANNNAKQTIEYKMKAMTHAKNHNYMR